MLSPLLTTKTTLPAAPALQIARARLDALLDRALQPGARVLLLCAPAGYGKTSALLAWLGRQEAAQARVAWLGLDPDDNDPSLFLAYWSAALRRTLAGAGPAPEAILHAMQAVPPATVMAEWVNALAAAAPARVILALDDVHLLHHPALLEAMGYFVEHMPANALLALTSRSDPALPLHRLRARGQLVEVRAAHLRFTPDETHDYLAGLRGLRLPPETLRILEDRVEGWPAGMQMAALALHDETAAGRLAEGLSASQGYLLDYLAEEVLNQQPPDIQRFLLQTAILDRLSVPLCDAVTGQPGASAAILDRLKRENLFLLPLDREGRWLRYHPLFADLLRVRLAEPGGLSPAPAAELHRRAADWLAGSGDSAGAVRHALAAADYAKAAALVEAHTIALMARGELPALVRWARALPAEVVQDRPWLCLSQAWALGFAGKVPEARALLETAERLIQASPERVEARGRLAYEIAAAHSLLDVTSGQYARLADWQRTLMGPASAGSPWARSVLQWSVGYASRMLGDPPTAIRAFQEMLATGQEMHNPWTILTAVVDLGGMLRVTGRLPEAVRLFRATLAEIRAGYETLPGFLGRLEAFLANALYETGAVEEAHQLVYAAIEHNRAWRNPNHDAYAWLIAARIALGQGQAAEAGQCLEEARQSVHLPGVVPVLPALYDQLRVRLWLSQGSAALAQAWAAQQDSPPAPGVPHDYEQWVMRTTALARVDLAVGQPEAAAGRLRALDAEEQRRGRHGTRVEALVLLALAEQAGAGLQALAEAIRLAQPQDARRVFLDEGPALGSRLAALGKQPEGQALDAPQRLWLDGLLQEFPSQSPPDRPAQPATGPLTARELEILRAMADGLSNPAIGRRFFISAGTVKAHSANIFRKLDVTNRTEAVARAAALGLLRPEQSKR